MAPPSCTLRRVDLPPWRRPPTATGLELSRSSAPGGEELVTVDGEIDLCTGPELLACLRRAVRHPRCRSLVVGLRRVRFLGARGIAVFMTIALDAHALDVRLAIVADHVAVRRPLQITGSADHLTLVPTLAAARAPRNRS